MEQWVMLALLVVQSYLALGAIFAIAFFAKGITKTDEGTKGSNWFFKLLITPGVIVFWVLLLRKWIKANKPKH